MSGDKSPPQSNTPNIRAQTGLSTPELIKAQQQHDEAAVPFLTGGTTPSTSDNRKDKHKTPNPHSFLQIQQLPPQTNIPQQQHIPNPATSASSIPPHMHHTHLPPNVSFSSSNPTIQPPPNFSPMTNVNDLPKIPCFRVPANHPIFIKYFNKNSTPESPSPESCIPQNQTTYQRQQQLHKVLDKNKFH
ncbi:hypothetical protein PCANC_08941 [Puccinia coronata f. sp. avenae]|uniref:Uncharacterized protein n=1 Tax=Puccinia coronata f. sp. avenae TaxID=200324 RepID=A0A2N5T2F4_9BASI|nr:hypothetical protein PCANC_08941 [Puccinia coronata f. sp. avenae]